MPCCLSVMTLDIIAIYCSPMLCSTAISYTLSQSVILTVLEADSLRHKPIRVAILLALAIVATYLVCTAELVCDMPTLISTCPAGPQ